MSNVMLVQPILPLAPPMRPDRPAMGSQAVRGIKRNLFGSSPEKSNVDTLFFEENEEKRNYVKKRYNIDLRQFDELGKCNKAISVNPKHGQRFANTEPYISLPGIKGK